jgi:hypothetical protein
MQQAPHSAVKRLRWLHFAERMSPGPFIVAVWRLSFKQK